MKFKKIMSVIASAVMLSSTIGFAAAATFPAPFSTNSAIVYGAAGNVQTDMAAAVNIQTAIGKISNTGVSVPEGSWQVKTSSDTLEIGESIAGITSYIDKEDLPLLTSGEMSTEKGTAKYDQFFYFEDTSTASSSVTYQEDDDENVGLFFKITSGKVIARYVLDFTSNLESDVVGNSLEDIEDEEITILGKNYVITNAVNASSESNVQLTLMGGADKVTISNGEELVVGGKTISVLVSSTTQAQFTIDGQTTSKLADGDTYKLSDGSYIGVSDITYQDFAGGLMQATVYVGADKLVLKNGTSMEVNGETISNARVDISASISGGDISISEIDINMTAEDDLYVPTNGKLSQATDLDEPEVLVSQNWDIVFNGLADTTYETIDLGKSTDSKIKLKFQNLNGDEIDMPLFYTNTSGVYGGEKQGYGLVLNISYALNGINKSQYFILNTADPTVGANANDARSFVLKYKGADKVTDTSPKARFDVLGVDSNKEVTLDTDGTCDLKLGGVTFSFANASSCNVDDCSLYLTSTNDYADYNISDGVATNFLRTKNNVLINITDTNFTATSEGVGTPWNITFTIDDSEKDGDAYPLTTPYKVLFTAKYSNNSDGEFTVTPSGGNYSSWVSDPDDNTKATYIDYYGNEITHDNPSGSPDTFIIKVPVSAVEPLVYVTSGAVTAGTAGGLALIVDDSKIDSVKDKNLVVVGGSCINTVAAKLLGSDVPLCTSAFTAKTGAGVGQYIIKTYANPYTAADSGKVAMLVAGYEAADTVSAGAKVAEKTVTTDVGTGSVYPIVGA